MRIGRRRSCVCKFEKMSKHHFDIEDEKTAVANSIRRIADLLDRTPTQKQYKTNRIEGELSLEQILYRYGRWSDAVKHTGLKPNAYQKPPRSPEITEQQLIDDFVRVANKLARIPGATQFRSESKYSWTPFKTRWGSWRGAVDYILKNHSDRFTFDASVKSSSSVKA
ncbi:MAG: hypothetical protein KAT52_11215 [Desulfobacterales bacterium]|nr:hypothetical protein [Desulfobacterales bacterium]